MILMLERNLWEKALPIKLCNNNIKKGNNQYLCYHKIILKHYHEEVKNHNVVLTYNNNFSELAPAGSNVN